MSEQDRKLIAAATRVVVTTMLRCARVIAQASAGREAWYQGMTGADQSAREQLEALDNTATEPADD